MKGKRSLTIGLASSLAMGVIAMVPSTAAAQERRPAGSKDIVSQFLEVAYSGKVGVQAGKKDVHTSPLTQVVRLVDDAGKLLQPATSRNVALDPGGDSGFACVRNGKANRGFVAHDPIDTFAQSKEGLERGLFHIYSQQKARTVGRYKSLQFEMCGIGGADLDNGFRAYKAGVGMAYMDPASSHLIGWRWQTGSTPKNYSLELGFELATEKSPLAISGSIAQQPHEKLTGSFVPPVGGTGLDPFGRNAVLAWWEDGCETRVGPCLRKEGSTSFQGAVAHGLWEFPQSTIKQKRWFGMSSFYKQHCGNFYGFSCG